MLIKTAFKFKRGQIEDFLNIPIIEGQNRQADRNRPIGSIKIFGNQIKRDVPAGSEVEITIEIDKSRLVRAKAYIPVVDEEFEGVFPMEKPIPNPNQLKENAEKEKQRLCEIRKKVSSTGDLKATQLLQKVDEERMEHEVESTLAASNIDPDAANKCENRIFDLRVAIDDIEDALNL